MTTTEKIRTIDKIISGIQNEPTGTDFFICNWYEWIATDKPYSGIIEEHMVDNFPELHDMIINVGLSLVNDFVFHYAWETEGMDLEDKAKFRIEKLTELKEKLCQEK
jgi:hypothetical protein